MSNDNITSHNSTEYDEKILVTIPNYGLFHKEIINLVNCFNPNPEKWLDTGCGTGSFSLLASNEFYKTEFVLADPSEDMLKIAKKKNLNNNFKVEVLESTSTQELCLSDEYFDVITAIQAHHYLDENERKKATSNCFRMLKNNGIYITFENTRPFTRKGIDIAKKRVEEFQIKNGKSEEEVIKFSKRFDTEYFPININQHLDLLYEIGFTYVEVFWYSYMQAGFYAIK